MNRVTMQGEAYKTLNLGSNFYFHCKAPLEVGDVVTLSSEHETIKTTAEIKQSVNNFYEGQIIEAEPVEDFRLLTKLM